MRFIWFLFFIPALVFAQEPTLADLQSQLELIKARQLHAVEAIERGKMQIEAGTLRQGMAIGWEHELETKRAEIEAKIEKLKEAQKKPKEEK